MVANIVTFRPRMAVRQVGAALGFPETIIDRLAKSVDGWFGSGPSGVADAISAAGLEQQASSPALPWQQFVDLLERIAGAPRHLSIHVGGMLVTGAPLVDVVPVERATMPGRVVVQFNKDDVEDLGLIKMDLLGLRTLGAVAECLDHIEAYSGERPDLDALPLDDPAVYDMICAPDTIGLFQIESRAQQQSLYQSQPREFNELIVQVAIIRPGPIQGNAVHPYLRRRQGLEPVTYAHPKLEPILADTRGVVLYQEQILRIVMELAGYTAGEADRFRRAMNRHRSRIEMEGLRDEFVSRCVNNDVPVDVAEEIFRTVAGFAQFGFCKSHAAAFARTAYETGWLRLYHPAAWLCALLNAQPMGFYHPSVLVEDGKRHGVRTLPVDVGRSRARCTLEWVGEGAPPSPACAAGYVPAARPPTRGEMAATAAVAAARRSTGWAAQPWAVRLGYGYVRALGPTARAACDEASRAGAITSVAEFWRHTRLPRPAMENLVMVGAFDAVTPQRPRRELLWELRETEDGLPPRRRAVATTAAAPLLAGTRARLDGADPGPARRSPAAPTAPVGPPRGRAAIQGARAGDLPAPPRDLGGDPPPPLLITPAPAPSLPEMNDRDRTASEYRLSELSTGPHLVAFIRHRLEALGCAPIAGVKSRADGSRLRVGGLVIARQAPVSAKGFRFFTLADEGGHLDLVFRPAVAAATRAVANFHPLLVVDGTLQSETGRLNLLVTAVRAIDSAGNLIAPARAQLGGGADRLAPPPQHGHTSPPTPPSHDFR
jgi:error-prone DNA polymerase